MGKKYLKYTLLLGAMMSLPLSIVSCLSKKNNESNTDKGVILQERNNLQYVSQRKQFNNERFDYGKYNINYKKLSDYILNYDDKKNYTFDELFNIKGANLTNNDSILPNLRLNYLDGIGDLFNFFHFFETHVQKSYNSLDNNVKQIFSYKEYLKNAFRLFNNNALEKPAERKNILEQAYSYLVESDSDFLKFIFWLNVPSAKYENITSHPKWAKFNNKILGKGFVARFIDRTANSIQQIYANGLIITNPESPAEKIFDQLQVSSLDDPRPQILKSIYFYRYTLRLLKYLNKDFKIKHAYHLALQDDKKNYYDQIKAFENSNLVVKYNKERNKHLDKEFLKNSNNNIEPKYYIQIDKFGINNKEAYNNAGNSIYEELDVYDVTKLNDMMIYDTISLITRNTVPNFQTAIESEIIKKFNFEIKNLSPTSEEYVQEYQKNINKYHNAKKQKEKLIAQIEKYYNAKKEYLKRGDNIEDLLFSDDVSNDYNSFNVLERFYKVKEDNDDYTNKTIDGIRNDNMRNDETDFIGFDNSTDLKLDIEANWARDSLTKIVRSNKISEEKYKLISNLKPYYVSYADELTGKVVGWKSTDGNPGKYTFDYRPLKMSILNNETLNEWLPEKVKNSQNKDAEVSIADDYDSSNVNNLSGITVYGNDKVDQFYFDNDDFLNADHPLVVDDIVDHFQNFLLPFGVINNFAGVYSDSAYNDDLNNFITKTWNDAEKNSKIYNALSFYNKSYNDNWLNKNPDIEKYLILYKTMINGDKNEVDAFIKKSNNNNDFANWKYIMEQGRTGIYEIDYDGDQGQHQRYINRDYWLNIFSYPVYKDGVIQYISKPFDITATPLLGLLEPTHALNDSKNYEKLDGSKQEGASYIDYLVLPKLNDKKKHTDKQFLANSYFNGLYNIPGININDIHKTLQNNLEPTNNKISLHPQRYLVDAYVNFYFNNDGFNNKTQKHRYYGGLELVEYTKNGVYQDDFEKEKRIYDDSIYSSLKPVILNEKTLYKVKAFKMDDMFNDIYPKYNKFVGSNITSKNIFKEWYDENYKDRYNRVVWDNIIYPWEAFINKYNDLSNSVGIRNGDEVYIMKIKPSNSQYLQFINIKKDLRVSIENQIKDPNFKNKKDTFISKLDSIMFNENSPEKALSDLKNLQKEVNKFITNNAQDVLASNTYNIGRDTPISYWYPRLNRFGVVVSLENLKILVNHLKNINTLTIIAGDKLNQEKEININKISKEAINELIMQYEKNILAFDEMNKKHKQKEQEIIKTTKNQGRQPEQDLIAYRNSLPHYDFYELAYDLLKIYTIDLEYHYRQNLDDFYESWWNQRPVDSSKSKEELLSEKQNIKDEVKDIILKHVMSISLRRLLPTFVGISAPEVLEKESDYSKPIVKKEAISSDIFIKAMMIWTLWDNEKYINPLWTDNYFSAKLLKIDNELIRNKVKEYNNKNQDYLAKLTYRKRIK